MKKLFLLMATTMLMAITSYAQQGQLIPTDQAVRIGKLDNGITYYIRHNAEPKGQANFYIAQKVGSILEEEDQRGLAHFLEHMCFNGTEHFPGNNVIKYCERIGVKFGADLNAYTGMDETVYNIDNVPVTDKQNIDSCLWILHDWADGLLLNDEDIDHERGVIHEEWRSRANASIRLLEKLLPRMYPVGTNHARPDGSNRYGYRLPIGLMDVVDNFPYQALRDYYDTWYRPDLQGIIIVGDIDIDETEAKVRDIFGRIAKPANIAERYFVEVPDNATPIVCMASDKEQSQAITYIFMKHDPYPMAQRGDMNYYVWLIAQQAATRMINARLQEMLQNANPPFIGAEVEENNFFIAKNKNAFQGMVVSSEAGLTDAVKALYREMLRAVRCGFTDTEYERTKAQMLADIEAAYNARDKKKSKDYCQEYVHHFLDMEPIPSIEDELALCKQITASLNADMVGKILAEAVKENNLVVCGMLPDKNGITYPTEEELTASLASVAAEKIEAYVDAASNEPLMASLPKPGHIVKSKPDKLGYTKYKLSNGVTVYYRQTDFNADQVLMYAVSNGGTSLYPESMVYDLKAINEVLAVSGLGSFSRTDLPKVLAGKKVSVTPQVSLYDESITSSATPKDLETMFQLNYLYFTAMRMDLDAYNSWRERARAALANRESNPSSALQDSVTNVIFNHPKRAEQLRSDHLDAINYEHAMQIARERFCNADDFTFIITGAVDEATLIPLLEQYIAALPTNGKREVANIDALDFTDGQHQRAFNRQMEVPMVTTLFFDQADMHYTLKNKLSYDLALNALSVVLLEEIREKEGGTYDIGAYGNLSARPAPRQQAVMQIGYQTNPEKFVYLNQRVRDIVAQFAAKGPSEENLAKGKEYLLKNYREQLRENSFWQETLAELLATGVDLATDYEAVLASITTNDARRVIATLMEQKNHSEIIMVGVK